MRAGPRNSPTPVPGRGRTDDEVELGFVAGVFGVQGEVRLHLHNREESVLFEGPTRVVLVHPDDGRRVEATLETRPGAGKRVLGRLHGVASREEAAGWMGWRLVVATADLPDLEEDEFWWWQVEGLPVHVGGGRVGEIVAVHATAAGEIFEVRLDGRKDTVFVPVVERFVALIDLEAGRVLLEPIAVEEA